MTAFPGSPCVLKGGIVLIDLGISAAQVMYGEWT
jgi:hypothetical protein